MHSAQRSRCQAIDSIKSDKNNSGNSEVAWQDPSSLAGRATCHQPRGQWGRGPVAAHHVEPPSTHTSSLAQQGTPRPHGCTFPALWAGYMQAAWLVGERWQGRLQAGGAEGTMQGPLSQPAHATHTPAWLHTQAGWAQLHTRGVGSREAELPVAQGCKPWASAGRSVPACSSCLRTRAPLGHAEPPARAQADSRHLPVCKQQRCKGD